MASPAAPPSPLPPAIRRALLAVAALTVAVYAPTLSAPFVFDDIPAITANPAITPLWPPTADLWSNPAGGVTTTGRPLTAFTFAVNHTLHGVNPAGYRLVNLALHLANAALLFGLLRRTRRAAAPTVALIAAALWCLHPLATNVVTYVAQRAESLAAGGLLLALYAWTRAQTSATPRRWHLLTLGALVAGLLAKETAVVGPLLLLLFDRTFFAATWRSLWHERGRWHLASAATWTVPIALALFSAGRGDTAGWASEASPFAYLLTQSVALLHYLRLAVWPVGLVFDYGTDLVPLSAASVTASLLLAAALLGFARAWIHRPGPGGFLGLTFFVLLAPSSSMVPVATQTMAEHRFYLPLALVTVGLAAGLSRLGARRAAIAATLLTLSLAGLTGARNQVYRTAETLWADTVARRPDNARAHLNLGIARLNDGQPMAAWPHLQRATTLAPRDALGWFNQGIAAGQLKRSDEAIAAYTRAIELDPFLAEAANNLGNLLLARGDLAAARQWLRRATQIKPAWGTPWLNLARCETARRDPAAAQQAARQAASLLPQSIDAQFGWARAAYDNGDLNEARLALERTLQLAPSHLAARQALIQVLADQGDYRAAILQAEQLQRENPADQQVQRILDWLRNQAAAGP